MIDLISRQAAIDALMKRDKELRNINWYDKPFAEGECRGVDYALEIVNALPSAQPEIVRCKDCKHRPTKPDDYNPITTDGFALEFPDEKCPCQCEDGWYSRYPDDDWFCADGERREEDAEA